MKGELKCLAVLMASVTEEDGAKEGLADTSEPALLKVRLTP